MVNGTFFGDYSNEKTVRWQRPVRSGADHPHRAGTSRSELRPLNSDIVAAHSVRTVFESALELV